MGFVAVSSGFLPLLLLACPVSMGVMMWFMGRGMMGGRRGEKSDSATSENSSFADLEAEQARLAEKIESLQGTTDGKPQVTVGG